MKNKVEQILASGMHNDSKLMELSKLMAMCYMNTENFEIVKSAIKSVI